MLWFLIFGLAQLLCCTEGKWPHDWLITGASMQCRKERGAPVALKCHEYPAYNIQRCIAPVRRNFSSKPIDFEAIKNVFFSN
jgi:hypothetical protein